MIAEANDATDDTVDATIGSTDATAEVINTTVLIMRPITTESFIIHNVYAFLPSLQHYA